MNKEEIKKIITPKNGIEEAIIADLNFIDATMQPEISHKTTTNGLTI